MTRLLAAIGVLLVAPVFGVILVVGWAQGEADQIRPVEPVFLDVRSSVDPARQNVNIDLDWLPSRPLKTGPASGRVTAVYLAPGVPASDGSPVLAIDDSTRVLHVADRPFYREIRSGLSGWDVDELRRYLVDLGYLSAAQEGGTPLSRVESQAIADFQRAYGFRATGRFDPTTVVYSPVDLVVGEVLARVGDYVQGEFEVATSEAVLIQALVTSDDLSRVSRLADRRVQVQVEGALLSLQLSGLALVESDLDRLRSNVEGTPETLTLIAAELAEPEVVSLIPGSAIFAGSGVDCVAFGATMTDLEVREVRRLQPSSQPGLILGPEEIAGQSILGNAAELLAVEGLPENCVS